MLKGINNTLIDIRKSPK